MRIGNEMKYGQRKSAMALNEAYFWTSTIKNWKNLLFADEFKLIIIESLQFLVKAGKVRIYGYVIMPNHMHMIWEMIEFNGKELPNASFSKFTSHQFFRQLKKSNRKELRDYAKLESDRAHRFWLRDPLAVRIFSLEMFNQKLNYIHLNPLGAKWNLVERPEDYRWSSAKFYETGEDEFGIMSDYASYY